MTRIACAAYSMVLANTRFRKLCITSLCLLWLQHTPESLRVHVHVEGMLRFMSDINQPSLPTPFYSVLLPIFVFKALSTVFHSINSPENSVFSLCSSGINPPLLVLSTVYLFMKVSFSPYVIPSGWLGSKHQFTTSHILDDVLSVCMPRVAQLGASVPDPLLCFVLV